MKIIISAETEKKKSSVLELDKTLSLVLQVGRIVSEKFKYKECRFRRMANSISLTLTK